jgi:hypothetical protein
LCVKGGLNTYGYVNSTPTTYVDRDGKIPINVVTGLIGGLTSFVGNVAGQWISSGGKCVSWKNAFIAGGVGAATGFVQPWLATSGLRAMGLGAASNLVQYGATQYANDKPWNTGEVIWNLGTGALGGRLGGAIRSPNFLRDTSGRWMNPKLAKTINDDLLVQANTSVSGFTRNFAGALLGNSDGLQALSDDPCGCPQ